MSFKQDQASKVGLFRQWIHTFRLKEADIKSGDIIIVINHLKSNIIDERIRMSMPPSLCVIERVPKASEIVAKEMDQKAKGKAEKKIATWKDLIKLNVGGQNGLKEEAVPAVRKEMSKK